MTTLPDLVTIIAYVLTRVKIESKLVTFEEFNSVWYGLVSGVCATGALIKDHDPQELRALSQLITHSKGIEYLFTLIRSEANQEQLENNCDSDFYPFECIYLCYLKLQKEIKELDQTLN